MSANKNLSKLALKVNTSGEVTDAGLESTYVSNAFFQDSTNPNLVSNGYFESVYTAADVLTKIKTVDGAGSGLDADTLDGSNSSFFTNASNISTGTLGTGRLSGTYPISISGSADRLDGLQGTDFTSNNYVQGRFTSNNHITTRIGARATNTYVKSTFSSNNYLQTQLGTKLNSSSYTASDVLTKIKTVDGAGSGLDADLLDGKSSTDFTSNNYIQDVLDTKASNTYVNSTFTSNNYFQDSVMPVGAGSDKVFYENDQNVTTNYTITTGKNAMSAGPITLDPGVIVTIPSGSEWSIT